VFAATDFLVTFGSGLTVNVSPGTAYIRGNSTADQGVYRVNNYSSRAVTLAAADATNPRIDQIVLQIRDAAEDSGANNDAQVVAITGQPSNGATLDNRNGATSLAVSQPTLILLADVLVNANNSPAMSATSIRARRPLAMRNAVPTVIQSVTARDMVAFECPMLPLVASRWNGSFHAGKQGVYAMYLPRRIAATTVRFRYVQDTTTAIGTGQNWTIAIFDISGRMIAQTGATAFAGAANGAVQVAKAFSPSVPAGYVFEAGWYYVGIGLSSGIAAGANVWFPGYNVDSVNFSQGYTVSQPGVAFKPTGSPGTVWDASNTILPFTDVYQDPNNSVSPPLPVIALSNG
jgi:hypothetical protein